MGPVSVLIRGTFRSVLAEEGTSSSEEDVPS